MNPNTFTRYIPDMLVKAADFAPAMVASRIASYINSSEDGVARVSISTLCNHFGKNKITIQRAIAKLVKMGILEVKKGTGRGNTSSFRKGINFDTFYDEERVSKKGIKSEQKGYQNYPHNLNITKYNNINKKNKGAYARELSFSQYYSRFGTSAPQDGWIFHLPDEDHDTCYFTLIN